MPSANGWEQRLKYHYLGSKNLPVSVTVSMRRKEIDISLGVLRFLIFLCDIFTFDWEISRRENLKPKIRVAAMAMKGRLETKITGNSSNPLLCWSDGFLLSLVDPSSKFTMTSIYYSLVSLSNSNKKECTLTNITIKRSNDWQFNYALFTSDPFFRWIHFFIRGWFYLEIGNYFHSIHKWQW